MIRKIFSRVLLVALGGLLGLAALEVVFHFVPAAAIQKLRSTFLVRSNWQRVYPNETPWINTADERFGWAFVPGSKFESVSKDEFDVPIQINSKGLRDREIPYEKAPDTFRILLLGDSFSAALQVPLDQAWPKIAEKMLSEHPRSRRKVEIVNSGVPRYGTTQELLYYRYEGYKYNPDFILLQIYANDIFDNYPEGREPGLRDRTPFFVFNGEGLELKNFPYRPKIMPVSQNFPVFTYVFRPFLKKANRPRKLRGAASMPPSLLMYASPAPSGYDAAWEMEARLLRELAKESAQRGTKLAAVLIPERYRVYPFLWNEFVEKYPRMKELKWDLDEPDRKLTALLRKTKIDYLDLMPPFREQAKKTSEPLFHFKDGHLSALGHRMAGELLAEWMLEHGVVPQSGRIKSAAPIAPGAGYKPADR